MKTPLPPVLRAALYRRAVACAWLTVCERQHRYPHLTLESLEAAIAAELEGFYLRQHGEEKGRQIACALLEEEPEACFVLEDSRSGLMAAHAAGCKPVMVPDLWQPDGETEQILYGKFTDLDEVKEFLKQEENQR